VSGRALAALALAALTGCAPRPALLRRAIAARGGPLPAIARDLELDVRRDLAGTWRWRTVFALPDRYAVTVVTTGEPDHYLFDGAAVRAFVGDALVSEDPTPDAPLRSSARFTAVANLDALLLPGVQVAETGRGLVAVFPDRGDRYMVALDDRLLVASVEGPIDLPPFARGELTVGYDDERRVDGLWLAHRASYVLDGVPLAEERTIAACALPGGLGVATFASPAALPSCPARSP
jgi:hypothetical protein